MANANFKKGETVYLFGEWDRRTGCCYFQTLTVISAGKQQAAFSRTDGSGKNLLQRVYASEYNRVVRVADCADPVAEATRRSVEYRAIVTAQHERAIAGNVGDARYVAYMQGQLDILQAAAPRGASYETVHAELMARMAAAKAAGTDLRDC